MKLLNLGCGTRFHPAWTNLDLVSHDKNVQQHDFRHGIPFPDNYFDVVYHSHLLEHFTRREGEHFIRECGRVLKPGGIVRVAVPDLERIARQYLANLELALQGDADAVHNYDWILLEMYDQATRNESGGEMARYLLQERIPNEEYVYRRMGEEVRNIRGALPKDALASPKRFKAGECLAKVRRAAAKASGQLLRRGSAREECAMIGEFRLNGEVHYSMYDRYSLGRLLRESGFERIEITDAFESNIPGWGSYELDARNNMVLKPDSLFMEAHKP